MWRNADKKIAVPATRIQYRSIHSVMAYVDNTCLTGNITFIFSISQRGCFFFFLLCKAVERCKNIIIIGSMDEWGARNIKQWRLKQ